MDHEGQGMVGSVNEKLLYRGSRHMGKIVIDGKWGSGRQERGYGKRGIRISCFIRSSTANRGSSVDWLGSYSIHYIASLGNKFRLRFGRK